MSFMAACIWAIILGSGLKPASARFAGRLRFELPMLVLTSPGQKTDTPMLVLELRAKGLHHADERKFRSGILSITRCFEKDVIHRLHRGQATKMSEHGTDLIVLTPFVSVPVPAIIANAGKRAARRFVEFFTANIQNPST